MLVPVETDPCDDAWSDVPLDESEEAQAEWEQAQAVWAATGFPGCEPVCPVKAKTPRQVDEGFVIVPPDEVQAKAQPCTGRKAIFTSTAAVLVAGWQYSLASATTADLWLQVAALLLEALRGIVGLTLGSSPSANRCFLRGERPSLTIGNSSR